MPRPLAALERFIERLVERPAARFFKARVEPIQVQRRLERAMDEGHDRRTGHVPDTYRVRLHPADAAALEPIREALEVELGEELLLRARRGRLRLGARPAVTIVADPTVTEGEIVVVAWEGGEARGPAEVPRGIRPPDRLVPGPRADPPVAGPAHGHGSIRDAPGSPRSQETPVPAPLEAPARRTAAYELPAPRLLAARLLVRVPGAEAHEFMLRTANVRVGRGEDNDLVLPDGRVSRHHGQFTARQGALVYADLGSTNGSLVNGERVAEVALGPGDVVQLGDSTLTLLAEG
jgi:hypothetical protein